MAKALGASESDEIMEGIHQLSQKLHGDVGLFFTNEPVEKVEQYFESIYALDFARAGCITPESVVIEANPTGLKNLETDQPLPATAEPQLRSLGLPTLLRGGTVLLATDSYQICQEGDALNSERCRLLKMLGIKLANFKVVLLGRYCAGNFVELNS